MKRDHDKDLVFSYFADCALVKGAKMSALYDLSRQNMVLWPTSLFDFANGIVGKTLAEIESSCSGEGSEQKAELFGYLIDNEFGLMSANPEVFPNIKMSEPEFPEYLKNAIVDVDANIPNFSVIISQLSELHCEFLQLRFFSAALLDQIEEVLQLCSNSPMRSCELVIPYVDETELAQYEELLVKYPACRVTFYSTPEPVLLSNVNERNVKLMEDGDIYGENQTRFVDQLINSCDSCGSNCGRYLNAPSLPVFRELHYANGCLNGKISIDVDGNIKNCPSSSKNFLISDDAQP